MPKTTTEELVEPLLVRFKKKERELIKTAAEADKRSATNLVRKIVVDELKRKEVRG